MKKLMQTAAEGSSTSLETLTKGWFALLLHRLI